MIRNVRFALILSLTLGLMPFVPEPHIVGKLRWVAGGAVGMKPMDWFDLLWHGWPWVWLGVALVLHLPAFQRERRAALRDALDAGALLVDVRSVEEFDTGSVEGAHCVPLDRLPAGLEAVSGEDRESPLVVFCRSGARSARAARILHGAGYKTVIDLGDLGSARSAVEAARAEG